MDILLDGIVNQSLNNNMKKILLLISACIVIFLISGAKSCIGRSSNTVKSGSSNYNTFSINAPFELTATAISSYQINLSWQDNSNNEDGFEIWRSLDGINWGTDPIATVIATFYSDTSVSLYNTNYYFYRVCAFNAIGDRSVWSNSTSVTILIDVELLVWSSVAAGANHTIALTTAGAVWSWGRNDDWWQLGIGDTSVIYRYFPTLIASDFNYQPFDSVTAIFAGSRHNLFGSSHNLVLKTDGTLWGWGANGTGQLGTGDITTLEAPLPVTTTMFGGTTPDSDWLVPSGSSTGTNLLRVAVGSTYTIALKSAGTLWAWGFNEFGQLGDGTIGYDLYRTTPEQIGAESDWLAVAAGYGHTIGLKSAGTLWAWGYNNFGQLGDGTQTDRLTPKQIDTDSDWVSLAAGEYHTIGLKSAGTLWAWGKNDSGQLGDGTQAGRLTPRQIGTEADWTRVATGDEHTIGLKSTSTLWAWGENNYGQLGDGTQADRLTPRQIGTEADWTRVAAGEGHTIGIKSNNTIWIWGFNQYGQLGLGDTIDRDIPYPLGSPSPPTSLIATAVSLSQIVLIWQDNSINEDGFKIERKININGTWEQIATVGSNAVSWVDQTPNSQGTYYYYRMRSYNKFGNSPYYNETCSVISGNWSKINAGSEHTLGLKSTGILWAWGYNSFGQLGDGTQAGRLTPRQIGTESDWLSVVAGEYHTIGLKSAGTLWVWGKNNFGQLGLGNSGIGTERTTPTQIGTGSDWFSVAAGASHTIGLKSTDSAQPPVGTIWGWGHNGYGQLGDGTSGPQANRYTPRQIGTESDWLFITAGYWHTVGLKSIGIIWVWGRNNDGQLGDGTKTDRVTPKQIDTDSDWVSLAAGEYHTIGLKSAGTIWTWGYNLYGQLGLGDFGNGTERTTPTLIGTESDWFSVDAGNNHTIGLKSTGTIWAWGYNFFGQLGDGSEIDRYTLRQIGTESDWVSVAAGKYHTIGLKSAGTIWAWGISNQLGLGDGINRNVPTLVGE